MQAATGQQMEKKKFNSDTDLRDMKLPTKGRIYLYDSKQPGLRICVSSTGSKIWSIQTKVKDGKRISETLGSYPNVTLKRAREKAYELQCNAETGIDWIKEKADAKAKAEAEALAEQSVADVLKLYISMHVERNLKEGNSRKERSAQLQRHLKPIIARKIKTITKADLQAEIDKQAAAGHLVSANRIRAVFKAFFNWAIARGHIDSNPATYLQKATKEKPRTRTPSMEEVREIYAATFQIGPIWGPFYRLCILTGQRSRTDVAAMRWEWIDWDKSSYLIPSPKNGQPHTVHLSPDALAELEALRAASPHSAASKSPTGPVFTTTGLTASSGFAKAKERLDEAIALARMNAKLPPMPHWRTHDLRRAQATALAEAGFDESVVDRIQNHVAGGSRPSAVAHVYNRAQKLNERAKALNAWSDMVLGRWAELVLLSTVAEKALP